MGAFAALTSAERDKRRPQPKTSETPISAEVTTMSQMPESFIKEFERRIRLNESGFTGDVARDR